jgi:hypothetical protein
MNNQTTIISHRGEDRFANLCLAASGLLWAVYTLPWTFTAQLWDDTVVFSYIARRMLAGDILYRDVWDHKGPLIFMLDALGLWLGGDSYGGIKFVEFVLMLSAMVLLYLALKPATGRMPAALFVLIVTVCIRAPLGEGNFTEEYAVFLQIAAIFCLLRLERPACRRPALYAFLAGLTGTSAFFFRANLLGFWGVLALYLVTRAVIDRDIRSLVRKSLWAILPLLLMGAAFTCYFSYHKALNDFLDAFIFHNIRYSEVLPDRFAQKVVRLIAVGQAQFPFLPLAAIGATIMLYEYCKKRQNLMLLFVPVWLIAEVLLSSLSGHPYPHYVITWTLPVCGLALYASYRIAMLALGNQKTLSKAQMAALAIAVVAMLATTAPALQLALQLYRQHNTTTVLAEYVRNNSSKNDTVYFYEGFDAKNVFLANVSLSTLFFADRKLPTPYVYSTFYLAGDDAFRKKMEKTLYENWLRSPPALVIITNKVDSMYLLIDPRIADLIDKNYHQVTAIERHVNHQVAAIERYVIYKPNLPAR